MTIPTHEALRNVPLFAALDDQALDHIAAVASEFECAPSHVLAERGQAGTGLFIIEEGSVLVTMASGRTVKRGPGEFVGELSVLTDTPRTARVSCESHVRGLAINRHDLAHLLQDQPGIAVAMASELARRLAEEVISHDEDHLHA